MNYQACSAIQASIHLLDLLEVLVANSSTADILYAKLTSALEAEVLLQVLLAFIIRFHLAITDGCLFSFLEVSNSMDCLLTEIRIPGTVADFELDRMCIMSENSIERVLLLGLV
jgi:hypothetical protein